MFSTMDGVTLVITGSSVGLATFYLAVMKLWLVLMCEATIETRSGSA